MKASAGIEDRLRDAAVRRDIVTVAGLTEIWCRGHHRDRVRRPVSTVAQRTGTYGKRIPVLCADCEEHLVYAERRRVQCPKEPKPFCSHCDVHCYKGDEREWQREMMRYSGMRSLFSRHAAQALRHIVEGIKHSRAHQ